MFNLSFPEPQPERMLTEIYIGTITEYEQTPAGLQFVMESYNLVCHRQYNLTRWDLLSAQAVLHGAYPIHLSQKMRGFPTYPVDIANKNLCSESLMAGQEENVFLNERTKIRIACTQYQQPENNMFFTNFHMIPPVPNSSALNCRGLHTHPACFVCLSNGAGGIIIFS